ncbi:MAG TPA: DUF2178 domain-containing protein, partial [Natronoarchaeum rubrum]|nr:DUF2178 domain-containing protein [Natronoarchaeum rubrum]
MTTITVMSRLGRRTYRRLVYGIVAVAVLGLFVGIALGQHLAGAVVYLLGTWIGGTITVAAPRLSDRTLQDERDYELHNHASGLALRVTMVLGLSVLPVLYVLDAGGQFEISGADSR